MTNKLISVQYDYTFKVGEMFFKSNNYKGIEFTKRESEAFKITSYKDDEENLNDSIEYVAGILNSLGLKDYVINKKTTKTDVSYKTVSLTEALDNETADDEAANDEGNGNESINITFNVNNVSGDSKDIEGFAKKISDSLKRQQGLR